MISGVKHTLSELESPENNCNVFVHQFAETFLFFNRFATVPESRSMTPAR
jgi:hypothetical protein